jgi:pyruvate,water dikinase
MPKVLQNARTSVKYRENMRLVRTRAFGIMRDLFLALGDRLVEAGKLNHRRDIFFLTMDELEAYHEGRSICTDLKSLVQVRRVEFLSYEKQDLPHRFETIGPVYHGNRYEGSSKQVVDPNASVLHGIGCYPGTVEAEVKVVLSPKDELSINGLILATVRTDPGWAPLFPTTSGIVVERGGSLSHSAVIARELGIPAVVGVPGLLSIIENGERVRLDGGAGTIERLGLKAPKEIES